MAINKKLTIRLDETISGHVQKKWPCPSCGKKRFVRFYNFQTGEYLDEKFGRCDRSENCVYYLSPYKTDAYTPGKPQRAEFVPVAKKINYVDKNILAATLKKYDENNFVQFIISKVGEARAMEAVFKYFVGTAKGNGTIFWQVDNFMQVRTAQKIYYLADGHRDKNNLPSKIKPYTVENDYHSCLFGEHLLFDSNVEDLVGIVESEKTSLLASIYMPNVAGRKIIWLASSGSNGLTLDKIQPLRGRDIWLVPDFSFHARATWGLVPMRKKYVEKIIKGETKSILLPDPDGDLYEYESAADRLRSIGCNVMFFNPFPDVDNGSDIADTFVSGDAPEELDMPTYGELIMHISNEVEIKPSDELSCSVDVNIPDGRHSFRLIKIPPEIFDIRTNNISAESKIREKYMKNEHFVSLVNMFDLEGGIIEKL